VACIAAIKIIGGLYMERTATSRKVQFEGTMDEADTNFFPGSSASTRHSRLRRTRAGCARQFGNLPTESIPTMNPSHQSGRAVTAPPQIVVSSTVKSSDLSTSIVIRPDPADQIQCGRTELRIVHDVVFSKPVLSGGHTKLLKMDVLSPASLARRPLVIYITGGGFMIAPKESALNLRTFVAESGFVVASIQYRTVADGATYADSLTDVKSAIRYLRAHADEYGIDSAHTALWGESAGGYLAAMAGVTGDVTTFDKGDDPDQSSRVQAVVDKFGPSDMSRVAADFDANTQRAYAAADNPIAGYIEGTSGHQPLTDSPIASGPANPLSYSGRTNPPFLLFHGDQDRLVSPSQTLILHQALRAAGVSSTRYVLHGAGHGDLAFGGDPQSSYLWSSNETMGIIVSFLQRTLR
jgi:acetyl esterase/lipase